MPRWPPCSWSLAAPLILLAMALVKLTSRGPAIYRQVRAGLGGRPFTIYKIRTMAHDCEARTGPVWATADDPRVTPLGRFLRRSHLDELPQLWNVLRGEMSLVGPRPERPEFVAQLQRAIPDYRRRLQVPPGVTGLAQVQLPPDTDLAGVRRKLVYDLYYIRRMELLARPATGRLHGAAAGRHPLRRLAPAPAGAVRRRGRGDPPRPRGGGRGRLADAAGLTRAGPPAARRCLSAGRRPGIE